MLRIVGWTGDGVCECGNGVAVLVVDSKTDEVFAICRQCVPDDTSDAVTDVFNSALGFQG